jgi:hypothetical protein
MADGSASTTAAVMIWHIAGCPREKVADPASSGQGDEDA